MLRDILAERSKIISDGIGGAVISWGDGRGDDPLASAIYAQRISASGEVLWTINGVAIFTSHKIALGHRTISDGNGGAIISWHDNSYYAINTQRINASGVVQWTAGGVPICTESSGLSPAITSDGSGGAIFTWSRGNGYNDALAQRIDMGGVIQWAANGVTISKVDSYKYPFNIIGDGSGGAIITWEDFRNDIGYFNIDLYAQRIYADGTIPDFSSLQVSLLPQEAINAGAQWQVDSGEWQNSGALVTGLSVGEHTIVFKSVPYWTSPINQTVTIAKYQIAKTEVNYILLPVKGNVNGDAQVDLTDAVLSLQILSGQVPTNINPIADVDGDSRIGMAEAIYAIQKAAGL